MKRKNKIIIGLIFAILIIIGLNNNVKAKSYTIEDMDIQATIQDNGDVSIKQNITYKFNGSYNGIYITIPYVLEDDFGMRPRLSDLVAEILYSTTA